MLLYLIRLLAGRDGRYSKAKYIVVKNKVLACVLLDNMSIYTRTKRRKSDRNKMTYFGLGLYIAATVVLLINIVCLIIPKVYTEPWIFETDKFAIVANTLNERISAIAIMQLFSVVLVPIAMSMIQATGKLPKLGRTLACIFSILIVIVAASMFFYFSIELFRLFM
jgi:hypothetical protein